MFDKLFGSKKDKQDVNVGTQGVVPFDDFKLVMKVHVVDSMFRIGIPVGREPYDSDHFRAKTQDDKIQSSITNWHKKDSNAPMGQEELKATVLPTYKRFVEESSYEPYDDLIANDKYISKSFKVDDETQYYLTTTNNIDGRIIISSFIIRNIAEYDPQMRATLLNIVATMMFQ